MRVFLIGKYFRKKNAHVVNDKFNSVVKAMCILYMKKKLKQLQVKKKLIQGLRNDMLTIFIGFCLFLV